MQEDLKVIRPVAVDYLSGKIKIELFCFFNYIHLLLYV